MERDFRIEWVSGYCVRRSMSHKHRGFELQIPE
jgi:hypothetical protein